MKFYPIIKKMTIQFVLTVFFIPIIIRCSKEKKIIINNDWQVESIKIHSDSALRFPVNTYILSFEKRKYSIKKSTYSIKLDVNYCSGKVCFQNNNKIKFERAACTFACCDSDFAEKIILMLDDINKYKLSNETLILTGENGKIINLKRK